MKDIAPKNFADRLIEATDEKKSCAVVGIDPRLDLIPDELKERTLGRFGKTCEGAASAILEFAKRIVDIVDAHVPAVKPQIAFYERFGWQGFRAYIETVKYARSRGLIVIGDAKRSDIGSTAEAYADGHLGAAKIGEITPSQAANAESNCALRAQNEKETIGVDALTINPYLGRDSIDPFIRTAKERGKGLFILAKTSNQSSGDFQDLTFCTRNGNGKKLFEIVAEKVVEWGGDLIGDRGYSSVGAVVGATYPEVIEKLRSLMPKSYFLVPGYGAQGGKAVEIAACFDAQGHGAVVNSSRAIIFAYTKSPWKEDYGLAQWEKATEEAIKEMNRELNAVRFDYHTGETL